ncbi:hypothetical protein VPNG_07400 [Cytospora leucostoma]|uniref:Uncharacterized protein n=1 Tax=Cytospora leucostoma TaxID=1230097 RepID=A0A423WMJ1_9PEZI|nr:hypothetical protein VPNG_07400 [Cytospora leucostoma]
MPFIRRLLVTGAVVGAPAYYAHTAITTLEAKYPRLQPEASSTAALRAPPAGQYDYPGRHHTPHVDVFGARVPARLLQDRRDPATGRRLGPEEAWARVFLESPALRLEGKLLGGGWKGPGDAGEEGFRAGQALLNGGLEVVRPPSPPPSFLTLSLGRPEPLLVQWVFPPLVVSLCRRAAADWGYPFRYMSGGRHEWSVGDVDARDGTVEVRFGSAHDYEWVFSEGKDQKTVPEWTARLHRAFARWLLDERVEALKKAAEAGA